MGRALLQNFAARPSRSTLVRGGGNSMEVEVVSLLFSVVDENVDVEVEG